MPPVSSPPASARDGRANNSLLTIVKAQILFLLSTLTEDNIERNQLEIRSLSETHGTDIHLHFIRRLIAAAQPQLNTSSTSSTYDNSSALTFRLLLQEVQRLARDPFLADRFRDAIDKSDNEMFEHFDLMHFTDRMELRPLEKLMLASSFVAGGTKKDLIEQSNTMIHQEWQNAVLALRTRPSFDNADLSPSSVAKLLSNLLSDPPVDTPALDSNQRYELLLAVWSKYGQEIMSPILHQILPTVSPPPATTLVQAMKQAGPEITSDPDIVRALLHRFGVSDAPSPQTRPVVEIPVVPNSTEAALEHS